jgi:hypothetical protein
MDIKSRSSRPDNASREVIIVDNMDDFPPTVMQQMELIGSISTDCSQPAMLFDAEVADAEVADAEVADTEVADVLVADALVADTEAVDAEAADTSVADALVADTEVADTEVADAVVADALVADAVVADAEAVDTDAVDAEAADTESVSLRHTSLPHCHLPLETHDRDQNGSATVPDNEASAAPLSTSTVFPSGQEQCVDVPACGSPDHEAHSFSPADYLSAFSILRLSFHK